MRERDELDAFRQSVVADLAILSRLLSGEMDRPLLEWMRVSRYPQGLGLALQDDRHRQAATNLSQAVISLPPVGVQQGRDALAKDYVGIFVSRDDPGLATESYWSKGSSAVLSRQKMVEDWYERHGFVVSDRLHRPADTLAFQLGFLAHLLDDGERAHDQVLNDCRNFMREHLLSWLPSFAEIMAERSSTPFYRSVAQFLVAYVVALDNALAQVDGDILSVPA